MLELQAGKCEIAWLLWKSCGECLAYRVAMRKALMWVALPTCQGVRKRSGPSQHGEAQAKRNSITMASLSKNAGTVSGALTGRY